MTQWLSVSWIWWTSEVQDCNSKTPWLHTKDGGLGACSHINFWQWNYSQILILHFGAAKCICCHCYPVKHTNSKHKEQSFSWGLGRNWYWIAFHTTQNTSEAMSSYQTGISLLLEFLLWPCMFSATRCCFQNAVTHSVPTEKRLESTQALSIELTKWE